MRWLSPNKMDRRVIKRFLILPTKINGEWRWLEYVRILQIYGAGDGIGWENDCYINKE
jgi:hypothetical protein